MDAGHHSANPIQKSSAIGAATTKRYRPCGAEPVISPFATAARTIGAATPIANQSAARRLGLRTSARPTPANDAIVSTRTVVSHHEGAGKRSHPATSQLES